MVQQVKVLAANPDDLGSIPGTLMVGFSQVVILCPPHTYTD